MAEKELATMKQSVTKASNIAKELVFETTEDLAKGSDFLTKIKKMVALLSGYRDTPTKKAYQAYKEIKAHQDSLWSPLIEDCEKAEAIVKQKGIQFKQRLDAEAEEARKKLEKEAAEIERKRREGLISDKVADNKLDKVAEKAADVEVVDGKVTGAKGGSMTFKKVKKVTLLNEALIPREFLVPNMVMINAEAKRRFDAGVEQIPGVLCELVDDIAGSKV